VVASRTKNQKVTKAKGPRKLSGKIIQYVPDSFDPEVHLPEPNVKIGMRQYYSEANFARLVVSAKVSG
jgi:hypothetical protein